MPRCLEPGLTIRISLDSDVAKPVASRPTFIFRAVTAREWRAATQAMVDDPTVSRLDMALGIIRLCLTGWQQMIDPASGQEIQFSLADLDTVAGPGECVELFDKLVNETVLSNDDKKKLESQRSSNLESSAQAAPAASA